MQSGLTLYFTLLEDSPPITAAVRCTAHIIIYRLNTGTVASNPVRDMDVHIGYFGVCVVL